MTIASLRWTQIVRRGRPTVISFQNSSTSTTASVTAPHNIKKGDILVLLDFATTSLDGLPTLVVPTGFTQINESGIASATASPGSRMITSYKLAEGNESSTSITGMDGANNDSKALIHFRPNFPASTLTVGDTAEEATTGDPAAQTVNVSTIRTPLIVFGAYCVNDAAVDPRTFTIGGVAAKDAEVSAATRAYLAYKIFNNAPQDVVVNMDDEGGANHLQSWYISVS